MEKEKIRHQVKLHKERKRNWLKLIRKKHMSKIKDETDNMYAPIIFKKSMAAELHRSITQEKVRRDTCFKFSKESFFMLVFPSVCIKIECVKFKTLFVLLVNDWKMKIEKERKIFNDFIKKK